jgi:SAM-dependent methyltransferase
MSNGRVARSHEASRMALTRIQSELYTLTHRGNPGDREFYAKACSSAHRILELGSGYGRLIPALLGGAASRAPQRELWGIEQDPHLLAAAKHAARSLAPRRQSLVHLRAGDMRSFDCAVQFDRIILPYNGLNCLLNRRDTLRCMKCVKRHLAPGGQFIFDVWLADQFHKDASSSAYHDDPGPILALTHRSQTWDVFEKSHLRRRLQRLDVNYTYICRETGAEVTISISQRYAPVVEHRELLEAAGLRVVATYGDFSERRLGRNSPFLVMRAT